MAQRDNFKANGGDGVRGRNRPNWPGYAPSIQPGVARLPGDNRVDQGDAREIITPPISGQAFDPRNFEHYALATALGLQRALSDPHVRMLMQTLIDNVARATFKPHVQPPWITKPFRGVDFGALVSQDVTAALAFSDMTDGTTTLSFRMEDGYMGVLREFAMGAVVAADWDSLSWRLVKSGVPVVPWNNITCQMGMLHSPRQVQILIMPGDTVSLQVASSSGAQIDDVQGWLYGWKWPVAVAGDVMNAHGQASVA